MNFFEINKIITAILVTILVVFGIGKISDIIFDKDDKNIVAYKVETPEGTTGEANAAETNVDLNALFAMADIAHGEKVFKKCKACHSVKDGENKIGPTLHKIVGRASASISGFEYSDGLKALGITWDEASLDKWIKKPRAMVKGTKMIFPGLKKADKRADLIEYLKTLK